VSLTWLLLGAALLLGGAPRPARHAAPERPDRQLSLPVLQALAAVAVVASCVGLLGPSRGLVAATVAVPSVVAGVAWCHRRPPRARPGPSLALALDLAAVALRAGCTLDSSLLLAAPAADPLIAERLARVGGLLRLGAEPDEAWRLAADDPVLAPVAAAARRSAASGVRLAGAFEQLAVDVRAQLRAEGEARAGRIGVLAAAPLGLCFLPSFVCLGIVPVVIGVAGAALSGLG
jgi:Flp pilus assembly protein TadB